MKKVTVKTIVTAIIEAQDRHDKVIAMIPAIKAAGVTDEALRAELKAAWNFADLSANRKTDKAAKQAYDAVAQKISYWIKTIFGTKGLTDATKESMRDGRRKAIVDVLIKYNIDKNKAARIAAELVK